MNREEAIKDYIMPALKRTWNDDRCIEIISAIEQDPCGVVLDKIRDEIESASHGKWYVGRIDGKSEEVLLLDEVLQIIDKYKEDT